MPVVIAASVDEALVRSSAGRHEASWRAGLAGGWRTPGALAVMLEADVSHRAERSALLDLQSTVGRASVLVEAHLGAPDDALRFVAAAGPATAVVWNALNAYSATTVLPGGRAVVGVDARLLPARTPPPDGWTVGLRVGGFASQRGLDLDLGLRVGWTF